MSRSPSRRAVVAAVLLALTASGAPATADEAPAPLSFLPPAATAFAVTPRAPAEPGRVRPVAASRPAARPAPGGPSRSRVSPARAVPAAAAAAPAARRAPAPRPRASGAERRLAAAVARIPGYRPGVARWVVTSAWGHWGVANWYDGVVYVSPAVPAGRLYDVAAHEWAHILSVLPYGGNVRAAKAAMNLYFGGRGLTGAERAADCMAILLGAAWTHHTACEPALWRQGARALLAGRPL